jgi:hypothetical protein
VQAPEIPWPWVDEIELRVDVELAGVLRVIAVDGKGDRGHLARVLAQDVHRPHHFQIDVGDLLARPEIG